jgi:peptidoglycan/LPS O-acetylase OafA/YrhL
MEKESTQSTGLPFRVDETLRPITPPTSRATHHLDYLDGWRGFAILAVLVGHFLAPPGANFGRLGVELFFVLSGRLMAEILFVRRAPFARFVWRRIARVYPALMTFVLLMGGALYFESKEKADALLRIANAMTFTTNYAVALYDLHTGALEHIWSLCVEEHCYLFLILLAAIARKTGMSGAWLCLAAAVSCMVNGIVLTEASGLDYFHVYWRSDVRAASILVACGLYLGLPRLGWSNAAKGRASWLSGLLGMVLSVDAVPDAIKYTVGSTCFAVSVCLIDYAPNRVRGILEKRRIQMVGMLSFSLYLWQQPFFKMIGKLPIPNVLLLIGAAVFAWGSYRYIEAPAREFLNRLAPGRTSRASVIQGTAEG